MRERPTRKKTAVVTILLGVALILAIGFLLERRDRRTNVVLVSIDTLNVDYTSPYNPEVTSTPNLEAFAREGVRFEHAYTSVPITLPSHTSLMTGLPVRDHGVMANGEVVPLGVTTLAEIFKKHRYHTAGFISLGVLKKNARLNQGFDVFDDPFPEGASHWYRGAETVLPAVHQWLDTRPEGPFFLWVHFSDPHEPYLPVDAGPDTRLELDGKLVGQWSLAAKDAVQLSLPLSPGEHRLRWASSREPRPDDLPTTGIQLELSSTTELSKFTSPPLGDGEPVEVYLRPDWSLELFNRAEDEAILELRFTGRVAHPPPSEVVPNYTHEVEYTDRHLGELRRMLDSAGVGENALWILVSDHGEGLYHHRAVGHATHVYEDQLKALWLMHGPGLPAGRVVSETPALLEDVAPTLMDHFGWEERADMTGHSLAGCWADGPCPRREVWWSYGLRHGDRRLTSVAGYRWPYKWLWRRGEGRQSHQLLDDPREERDLLDQAERPPQARSLAEDFPRVRKGLALRLRRPQSSAVSPGDVEVLRSLGYIGDSGTPPPE